ncbi:MAG: hypothetical protein FJW40_04615 [Acidobacteria bacterium]|nr:hypothetical protein [Acidobacteriota bacterium]
MATAVRPMMGRGTPQPLATAEEHRMEDSFLLRPFPNEDVYFHVKKIDNTRVVRAADPEARARGWKAIGIVSIAAMLLIGVLLPGAYGLLAGYQVHQLKQEQQALMAEQQALRLEAELLTSPRQLEQWAERHGLSDPKPEKVIHLGTPKGSLAYHKTGTGN